MAPTDLGLPLSLGGLPDPTRKMKQQRQRVTRGPSSSSAFQDREPLRQGLGHLLLTCYRIQRSLSPHMLFPAPLPVLRWGLAGPFLLEGLADQGTRQYQELPGDQADPRLPGTETAKGGVVPAGPLPRTSPRTPSPSHHQGPPAHRPHHWGRDSDLPSDLEDQLAQAGPGLQLLGPPVR